MSSERTELMAIYDNDKDVSFKLFSKKDKIAVWAVHKHPDGQYDSLGNAYTHVYDRVHMLAYIPTTKVVSNIALKYYDLDKNGEWFDYDDFLIKACVSHGRTEYKPTATYDILKYDIHTNIKIVADMYMEYRIGTSEYVSTFNSYYLEKGHIYAENHSTHPDGGDIRELARLVFKDKDDPTVEYGCMYFFIDDKRVNYFTKEPHAFLKRLKNLYGHTGNDWFEPYITFFNANADSIKLEIEEVFVLDGSDCYT